MKPNDVSDRADPNEDAAQVAELVLGLLPPDDARRTRRLIAKQPVLQRLHAAWHMALQPLAAGRAVAPPPQVKSKVEAHVFAPIERAARRRARAKWLALIVIPLAIFVVSVLALHGRG